MDGLNTQLQALKTQIDELMLRIDISGKASKVSELEHQASQADFWDDPAEAQKIMQQLSKLSSQVERWQKAANRINDAIELVEIAGLSPSLFISCFGDGCKS